jgi:hypothetical protein
MTDLARWMEDAKYLPPFMRDFHEQKRLFKRIGEVVENSKKKKGDFGFLNEQLPNWSIAHIYTVDFFLWFMARRGYTLQKSRKRLPYIDLEEDLRAFDKRQMEAFGQFLEAVRAENAQGEFGQ